MLRNPACLVALPGYRLSPWLPSWSSCSWRTCGITRPLVIDAEDLLADPASHLGSDVVVIGEWTMSGPTERGHMLVVVRPGGMAVV